MSEVGLVFWLVFGAASEEGGFYGSLGLAGGCRDWAGCSGRQGREGAWHASLGLRDRGQRWDRVSNREKGAFSCTSGIEADGAGPSEFRSRAPRACQWRR